MGTYRSGREEAINFFMETALWGIGLGILGSFSRMYSQFLFSYPTFETLVDFIFILPALATFIGYVLTVKVSGTWGLIGYPIAVFGGEGSFYALIDGQKMMFVMGMCVAFAGGYIIAYGRQTKTRW